ncbi:hypothetical protein LXM61_27255 [Priestia megaterium]|uniref:hypothetical protein n=1 Tax=Priestia megaterium TaxID=1404 RepID=UPI001E4E23B5|nr:hypothetical protein [Priestia megaterium]MCE4092845.1 hypothetical protein [Priestia megaterium]
MEDFIINKAGAKIYKDITRHKLLSLPVLKNNTEQGIVYEVLSTGVLGSQRTPIITVKEKNGEVVAYRLPDELRDWVEHSMGMKLSGFDVFPSEIEFGIIDNHAYAEIL